MKKLYAAASFLIGLTAFHANSQNLYFDPLAGSGSLNGGSYSWDGSVWTSTSPGTSATTTTWTSGAFARFYDAGSYTVTVNNSEVNTGAYDNTGSGNTLTINAAGSGNLSIASGDQGFLAASGTTFIINAPITGAGGFAPESTGTIYLNGNNSFGDFAYGYSSAPLVYFNNNNSFGSGPIDVLGTVSGRVAGLLSYGGTSSSPSTITLANPVNITAPGASGINFASSSYTPVVSSGNWSLGSGNYIIKNSGDSTAPLKISGAISGTGSATFEGANSGTTTLTGANTGLTGGVVVGAIGAANFTLTLGAANTIASASQLTLAGGTLNLGGFTHAMGSTPLAMSASSSVDFTPSGSQISLGDSHAQAWTGNLDLLNWNSSLDSMEFGTSSSGLTQAQLNEIEINGATVPVALDPNGYLIVPEPGTIALGLVGGLGLLALRKRKVS